MIVLGLCIVSFSVFVCFFCALYAVFAASVSSTEAFAAVEERAIEPTLKGASVALAIGVVFIGIGIFT